MNAAYVAGSFGGENGLPGCTAAHDGERTTRASTSIPAVAAARILRSYGASAYCPGLGSARSQEISIRSLPTPDERICADSEARSKPGWSSGPLAITPKKSRGTAAPAAGGSTSTARSTASRRRRITVTLGQPRAGGVAALAADGRVDLVEQRRAVGHRVLPGDDAVGLLARGAAHREVERHDARGVGVVRTGRGRRRRLGHDGIRGADGLGLGLGRRDRPQRARG